MGSRPPSYLVQGEALLADLAVVREAREVREVVPEGVAELAAQAHERVVGEGLHDDLEDLRTARGAASREFCCSA